MAARCVRIGVLGCGTVGTSFIRGLLEKSGTIRRTTGVSLKIVSICDRDPARARGLPCPFTPNPHDITTGPAIDIVVELMGGIEPACALLKEAIRRGKSVTTANKALLSERGSELFALAEKHGVHLGFEASVGGAIPIVKTLKESFIGNNLSRIVAILNGTTNYILSEMTHSGMSFSDALALARERGYAEANPVLDISGYDTAHKISILSRFAFRRTVSWQDIHVEGIQAIQPMDIAFAREFGYRVKLLAIAKRAASRLEIRVHPCLLRQDHLLSLVEGIHNAIYLEGDLIGRSLLFGEGAGGRAAASAVISDVVEISTALSSGERPTSWIREERGLTILPFRRVRTRCYCRFTAVDKPGVLARIAGILGASGISIASVVQKEENPERAVPIVMLTHEAAQEDFENAIRRINRLSIIRNPTVVLRIEE